MEIEKIKGELFKFKPNLFQKIWWPIVRFFKRIHYFPRNIKFFFQRGRRGYADCDTWSLDSHITDIMIPMLTRLRDHHCGVPCSRGESYEVAEKKWIEILNIIIAGFESSKRIIELDYPDNLTAAELNVLYEADMIIFKKGMEVLTENFFGLWD